MNCNIRDSVHKRLRSSMETQTGITAPTARVQPCGFSFSLCSSLLLIVFRLSSSRKRCGCFDISMLRNQKAGTNIWNRQNSELLPKFLRDRRGNCKVGQKFDLFLEFRPQIAVQFVKTFIEMAIHRGDELLKIVQRVFLSMDYILKYTILRKCDWKQ